MHVQGEMDDEGTKAASGDDGSASENSSDDNKDDNNNIQNDVDGEYKKTPEQNFPRRKGCIK